MSKRFAICAIVVVITAAVLSLAGWWGAKGTREEERRTQEDWQVVRQVLPTDANLVECGKCLDQCKWAIEKHVHAWKEKQ